MSPLLLVFALTGCTGSGNFHKSDAGAPSDPNLPFHQDADAQPALDVQQASPKAESALPFDNSSSRNLPAGTLLTVRLEDALSTAKLNSDNHFAAVLDVPVMVAGSAVLPPGTIVHGRVESARASHVRRDTGYVRLTLKTLVMDGKEVPLQTSSLFATGIASTDPESQATGASAEAEEEAHPKAILLTKGRRLTFRLTVALSLRPVAPAHSAANLLPTSE